MRATEFVKKHANTTNFTNAEITFFMELVEDWEVKVEGRAPRTSVSKMTELMALASVAYEAGQKNAAQS